MEIRYYQNLKMEKYKRKKRNKLNMCFKRKAETKILMS